MSRQQNSGPVPRCGRTDPFGSKKNMMEQYGNFQQNPMQFMAQRGLNIPQEYAADPDGAIQYLMNSGKLTQQQYNFAAQFANAIGGRGR